MSQSQLLRAARAAVLEASILAHRIQSELTGESTLIKKDRSPVTVADFSVQILICHSLTQSFSNIPFLAEEEAADLFADSKIAEQVCAYTELSEAEIRELMEEYCVAQPKGSRFWTLDPIDGTKGFLRGDQYAISLALIENGSVELGVLGCPNLPTDFSGEEGERGVIFTAQNGEGVTMCTIGKPGNLITLPVDCKETQPLRFCESVESAHTMHGHSLLVAQRLGITEAPLRIDSQCKYAALARGDAALYLRLPTSIDYQEKIWDHAAGYLCVKESGGTVTDTLGKELDFGLGQTLANNSGVVASMGIPHQQVIEAIASTGP